MTKQEAIDYLGVSARLVEGYVKAGRLSVGYQRTSHGRTAIFDDEEVKALKAERDKIENGKRRIKTATYDEPENLPAVQTPPPPDAATLAGLLGALVQGKALPAVSVVPVADKLLLSLDECHHLTGLSRDYLQQAIRDGKLQAQQIGRGWKVKRADLEHYIEKL